MLVKLWPPVLFDEGWREVTEFGLGFVAVVVVLLLSSSLLVVVVMLCWLRPEDAEDDPCCVLSLGPCFGGFWRDGGGGEGIGAERDFCEFGRDGDGLEVGGREKAGFEVRGTGLLSSSLEKERLTGVFRVDMLRLVRGIKGEPSG